MMNRIVLVVILVPLALVLVTLAVANRELVAFTLDPFNPGNPALTISLPFFVWLFLAGALGVFFGGCATWLKQGHYRRLARLREREAEALRRNAPPAVPPPPAVQPAPGRLALAKS